MYAITKSDLLDDELIAMLSDDLPDDLPHIFISAVTGYNITQLKDLLWQELSTAERLGTHSSAIVHRDKDLSWLRDELTDEGEDEDLLIADDDIEDIDDDEDFQIVDIE